MSDTDKPARRVPMWAILEPDGSIWQVVHDPEGLLSIKDIREGWRVVPVIVEIPEAK